MPNRAADSRASVVSTLDYAEAIGCRLVHAMAGVRPTDIAPECLCDTYLESLSVAANAAAVRGMGVLIEPIGPGSIANYIVDIRRSLSRRSRPLLV
ncbi:TIM barrel protein [Methylobacterium crusticola]|uniref:TIM barrel protein n=1 Tax=Methylobacterium crusticola TaxID=1697972 RepID=UPI0030B9011E